MFIQKGYEETSIGVSISSIFSALLEPSYRAAITDILTIEEYSKASGMVSPAGGARYLVSPMLAGLLLAVSDIRLLLLIDICTFIMTVTATQIVKRGVFILILMFSVVTCFMGTFQILAKPMVLDFSDSTTPGIVETVCACLLCSPFISHFPSPGRNGRPWLLPQRPGRRDPYPSEAYNCCYPNNPCCPRYNA